MVSVRHREVWDKCRHLLVPYDGSASQVSVLGLPKNSFIQALSIFGNAAPWPGFPGFVDDGETADGYPVDDTLFARMETHSIVCAGALVSGLRLSAMPLLSGDGGIDFELVFWSDHWFPDPGNDDLNCRSFSTLLKILDLIRALDPSAECACTARETGDPRLDRNEKWAEFW
jgi:hypothetical protein